MTAPNRPVATRGSVAGLGFLLILAAVILFVVAAIIAFTNDNFTDAQGIGYIGLACFAGGMIAP